MLTVPSKFTAYQGFDALFHSVEGYLSVVNSPMSEMVQLAAIENIGTYLPVSYTHLYLCFFGIVKRQGVKRRMDKRSTSEEQKSGYLGLTRADEERHLADVISVAQQNLERCV